MELTPKEKANELLQKMKNCLYSDGIEDAKKCALVAVEEILGLTPMYVGGLNPRWKYWIEAKQELENYRS